MSWHGHLACGLAPLGVLISDHGPVDLQKAVHADPHDQRRVPNGQVVEAGHKQVRILNEDDGRLLPLPVQLKRGHGVVAIV